ncbi:hypothetical protein [Pseudoalteromonas maricaloris]|uniref:hypothetical protein n=1 Tax=Pseudoalteromonas maricaloris TaxID=184924 RepID=UPI00029A8336|nr:hypothetical protein [Pseudoalteromonas flavipulchra]
MEYLLHIKEISLLIGIWVAIYGIDSWRREHKGKREIELAEDCLSLFYEAVDAVKQIRHPVSHPSETQDIERGKHESDAQFQARKDASVVYHRFNQHQELFNKVYASRYKFMSQIGKEESKPFDELRAITNEILFSARMLSRLWARDNFKTEEQLEKHNAQLEKYEDVFWGDPEGDDSINSQLSKVIFDIEIICQSVISGKGTLFGLLNKKLGK